MITTFLLKKRLTRSCGRLQHIFQRLGLVVRVLECQRGITGLETAIVLIAFVGVSSVFAFSALSAGLFSSDEAKDPIHSGAPQPLGFSSTWTKVV